jgi:esterase/lipase superfamily enzyme
MMRRHAHNLLAKTFGIAALITLLSCTDTHQFQTVNQTDDAQIERVFSVSVRGENNDGGRYDVARSAAQYAAYDVWVPANREKGTVVWPKGQANPASDFGLIARQEFGAERDFLNAVARSKTGNETFIFVHGFNTTHPEAVYRAAQLEADFDTPGPGVLFSWPSAGKVSAYVHDRDSVLIARDQLADLIASLTTSNRRVALVGHSMGSQLIMEALRTLSLRADNRAKDRIAAVLLISPDLDNDVFRAQARTINGLPRPFVIAGTPQDSALKFSAFLTGKAGRLGSLRKPGSLAELGVTEVPLTAFATGDGGDHAVLLTSPTVIAMMNALTGKYDLFSPDIATGTLLLQELIPGY